MDDDAAPTASAPAAEAPPSVAPPASASENEAAAKEAPAETDVDSIPWQRGDDTGFGVAFKDTGNPRGNNAFVGCAGFGVTLDASQVWVSHLYEDALRERGVRYLYAVQGPADVLYSGLEIGNSKVAESLTSHVGASTNFVLVVAHSSGAYVAHELLNELATGLDPGGVTANKIVYFDLDGGDLGLSQLAVDRMRRAYFVAAFDPSTNSYSRNQDSMVSGGTTYPQKGGYFAEDVANTGCNAGAEWCLHMTLITTQPHDPVNAAALSDYSDFSGREVVHSYIDEKAEEAGLAP